MSGAVSGGGEVSADSTCHIGNFSIEFVHLLYPDAGSYFLGAARIFAFLCFALLNRRNMKLVGEQEEMDGSYIKGLILPAYAEYFYLLIALNFIMGLTALITSVLDDEQSRQANNWIVPVEMGIYHCLNEGLAIFLTRYGAGREAFQRALLWGGCWGFFSGFIFFVEISIATSDYGFPDNAKLGAIIFLSFQTLLLIFYSIFLVVPINLLYRRPALKFYAAFNVIYQSFWIIAALLIIFDETWSACSSTFIAIIIMAVIQPYVIFKTLQIDSQYWQGRGNNPLADTIWDQVDLETAASMADNLTVAERSLRTFPVLHFGLINLEQRLGFVSGGFSRVYFGKLRGQKVALKMMFAMELTPGDVIDFYREAKVLHDLQHQNVVSCKGVCVMPPALTLVLEFCLYGSLFDFLYKPQAPQNPNTSIQAQQKERTSWDRPELSETVTRMSEFLQRYESTCASPRPSSQQVPSGSPVTPVSWGTPTWGIGPNSMTSGKALWDDNEPLIASGRPSASKKSAGDNSFSHSRGSATSQTSGKRRSSLNTKSSSNVETKEGLPDIEEISRASSSSFSIGLLSENDFETATPRNSGSIDRGRSSILESALANISSFLGFVRGSDVHKVPFAQLVPVQLRLSMMCDAVRAVAFLHSKQYMHCDIKSLNFLICEDFTVKLADFGETRKIGSSPRHDCPAFQARHWAPPEVLKPEARGDVYTVESDLFSLAIVLSEIITMQLPYDEHVDRIPPGEWFLRLTRDEVRPALPTSLPDTMREVIEAAWATDKTQRPSAAEVLDTLESLMTTPY